MNSLGAIFEGFADEVIVYVSDPRTGIQRRSKWPPTISEVVEACEDHREHLERMKRPKLVPVPRLPALLLKDRPQGCLANCFVPTNNPRYAILVEWAKTAELPYWQYGKSSDGRDGIWVNLGIWENPTGDQRGE